MVLFRWVIAAAIVALWGAIAWFNASCLWRSAIRKERAPSLIPLVGMFLALAATGIAPLQEGQRWPLVLAASLLDVGSLPYLALGIIVVIRERVRRP